LQNNVVKFTPRTAPVPKSDRSLIAEMKDAMLAATADGSVSEQALLDVASPEGCLHCHQLAHRALKALVKEGLLVRTPREGLNDYHSAFGSGADRAATNSSPKPRSGGQ
jgi:hypothetical protein